MKQYPVVAAVALAIAAVLASGPAAATTTHVDLSSYYNGSWSGNSFNGPEIATALEGGTGNAGTGITFSDPTGAWVAPQTEVQQTLLFAPVSLTSDSSVDALFNEFDGPAGLTVVFTNSANQTATYTLESGATARDFNNLFFYDTLTGSGTGVSAQVWWSTQDAGKNGNGEPSQRLDAQTFTLPTSWGGTDLTGMSFVAFGPMIDGDPGTGVLSALNVNAMAVGPITSVPEPNDLGVFGAGLAAVGALVVFDRRRRFRSGR